MYNQILLGADCLCSRLLLRCKKWAPKVICGLSAGGFIFQSILWWFSLPSFGFLSSFSLPVCFPLKLEMQRGSIGLSSDYSSQRCSIDRKVKSTQIVTLLLPSFSQIIRKQWRLQRLWSVHSSQWTGDEGTGQRVPSQGKLSDALSWMS